jgi:hypothetical protein
MATIELDLHSATEEERVERWRFEQLVEVGYSVAAAGRLAALPYVDLHLAVQLLRRACPEATALRILV